MLQELSLFEDIFNSNRKDYIISKDEIKILMPLVSENEISVTQEDRFLNIAIECKDESIRKQLASLMLSNNRTFKLARNNDVDSIELRNGILTVKLRRSEDSVKRIEFKK